MLVCNVSLRPPRRAIAAELAEAVTAADATATGQVVFATLVDDPANVLDIVDAYSGEIMLEAATAADVPDATLPAVYAADVAETATAASVQDFITLGPPTILTGLIGWWDASVTASVSLSGSIITAVANQVAGGTSLLPTTGSTANQPTYSATGFNSLPSMMFAGGSSQRLGCFSLPFGTGSELTFFFVGYMTSSTSTNYGRAISYTIPGGEDYNSNLSFCFTRDDSTSAATFFRNSVSTSVAFGYATNHRVICTVKSDGTKTIYIDGVATTVSLTGAAFGTGGTLAVGNGISVSAATTGWDGAIAEVGVATGWSDATTAAALDTYLKNKWGL